MKIELEITTKGDRLSDWLTDEETFNDKPILFCHFYRKLMRWVGIPEVTVLDRGAARVAWGEDELLNSVMLTGLTDREMINLCFDNAMLLEYEDDGTEASDKRELARLELLRGIRNSTTQQN